MIQFGAINWSTISRKKFSRNSLSVSIFRLNYSLLKILSYFFVSRDKNLDGKKFYINVELPDLFRSTIFFHKNVMQTERHKANQQDPLWMQQLRLNSNVLARTSVPRTSTAYKPHVCMPYCFTKKPSTTLKTIAHCIIFYKTETLSLSKKRNITRVST